MKVLILGHTEGFYDGAETFTDGVFVAPDDVTIDSLKSKYLEWAKLAENRIVKKKGGKQTKPRLDFVGWLAQCNPQLQKVEFEEDIS